MFRNRSNSPKHFINCGMMVPHLTSKLPIHYLTENLVADNNYGPIKEIRCRDRGRVLQYNMYFSLDLARVKCFTENGYFFCKIKKCGN